MDNATTGHSQGKERAQASRLREVKRRYSYTKVGSEPEVGLHPGEGEGGKSIKNITTQMMTSEIQPVAQVQEPLTLYNIHLLCAV